MSQTRAADRLGLQWMWLALGFWSGPVTTLLVYPYAAWEYADVSMSLGAIGAAYGLWRKYRSNVGPVDRLVMLVFAVLFLVFPLGLGGVGAMLSFALGRPGLVPFAGLLTALSLTASLMSGVWMASRHVRSSRNEPAPAWLNRFVDIHTRTVRDDRPLIQLGSSQWGCGSYNLLVAASLNIPLMFDLLGFGRYNVLIFVVSIMAGLLGWLAYKFGEAATYFACIVMLEKQTGSRFVSSGYREVAEYRRTLPFAKWLCRPEDLVEPAAPVGRMPARNVRRKLQANARGERAATR